MTWRALPSRPTLMLLPGRGLLPSPTSPPTARPRFTRPPPQPSSPADHRRRSRYWQVTVTSTRVTNRANFAHGACRADEKRITIVTDDTGPCRQASLDPNILGA